MKHVLIAATVAVTSLISAPAHSQMLKCPKLKNVYICNQSGSNDVSIIAISEAAQIGLITLAMGREAVTQMERITLKTTGQCDDGALVLVADFTGPKETTSQVVTKYKKIGPNLLITSTGEKLENDYESGEVKRVPATEPIFCRPQEVLATEKDA